MRGLQRAGRGWAALALLCGGSGVLMIVLGVLQVRGAAYQQSVYTQSHGIRVGASVLSEATTAENKGSTSAVTVRLASPVGGHGTTTVHIADAPRYSRGERVTVLVDPRDPGYAELPGSPYAGDAFWFDLVLGLLLIAASPLAWLGVRLQARRRARRAAAALL